MASFQDDVNDAVNEANRDLKDGIDEALSGFRKAHNRTQSKSGAAKSRMTREETTELYAKLEMRLREIEAFMTSKKFRLHCEINRI